MAATTDQHRRDGLRLPSIDAIPLQDMIMESDLSNRAWSDVRLDLDQDHMHEDQERVAESNEHEALLGANQSVSCAV